MKNKKPEEVVHRSSGLYFYTATFKIGNERSLIMVILFSSVN
ncbi:hypothetical protein B4166_2589 [Caldibacillus thermoamylovorans]|nr:hypothetical protein B4166_2589 [Caldibacillus thermoamylovorans]